MGRVGGGKGVQHRGQENTRPRALGNRHLHIISSTRYRRGTRYHRQPARYLVILYMHAYITYSEYSEYMYLRLARNACAAGETAEAGTQSHPRRAVFASARLSRAPWPGCSRSSTPGWIHDSSWRINQAISTDESPPDLSACCPSIAQPTAGYHAGFRITARGIRD